MNDFLRPHYDRLARFWQSGGRGEGKRPAIAFLLLALVLLSMLAISKWGRRYET